MTAPSQTPEAAGLEVVAWRSSWKGLTGRVVHALHEKKAEAILNAKWMEDASFEPLVTAESAQARIAELEARNLELSMLAYGWMEAHDLLASGKPYLFPSPADVPESIARAIAAEARVDRLAKALRLARPYVADLPIVGDADLAIIDAALQQETQP